MSERVLDVSGIDDGLPHSHTECATGTYGRMLRHLGLEPRVLGDSWGYRYNPDAGTWPVSGLRVYVRGHRETLREWYGVDRCALVHPDPESARRYMCEVVDDGRLVGLTVDLYAWPRSSFHGLHHFPHRILIAGYRDGEAFVVDGQGAGRWSRWVPVDVLYAASGGDALSGAYGGRDGRNSTVDIPRPAGRPEPEDRARYLTVILGNTDRYLRPDAYSPSGGGRHAIRDFCRDLSAFAKGMTDFPPELVVPGVSFLGALATQRQFNALFVELAAERTGADLAGSVTALAEVARGWRQLYHMLLYGFHAGRDMAPLFRRLTQRLAELCRQEAATMTLLDEHVRRAVAEFAPEGV
jgi:hypothetical protein